MTNPEQQQLEHRRWVDALLVSAQNRGWFGTISIEIKRGKIDLVRQEQTLKPPGHPGHATGADKPIS